MKTILITAAVTAAFAVAVPAFAQTVGAATDSKAFHTGASTTASTAPAMPAKTMTNNTGMKAQATHTGAETSAMASSSMNANGMAMKPKAMNAMKKTEPSMGAAMSAGTSPPSSATAAHGDMKH